MKQLRKPLFFILLIPAYFTLFTILMAVVLQMGSILWAPVFGTLAITTIGAWLLSHKTSLLLNVLGLACYFCLGGYLILIHFIVSAPRYGPWVIDVIMGAFVLLLAVIAFIYQLVMRSGQKRQSTL